MTTLADDKGLPEKRPAAASPQSSAALRLSDIIGRHPADVPPVLLSYQQAALATSAIERVLLWEKSRRIGASWGAAAEAATTSSAEKRAGGMDTLYIGYNLDMAREFIGDCAFWAKHLAAFAGAVPDVEEFVFEDQDSREPEKTKAIQAFRIRFASGFEITALSSRPRSLRGRQGFVIIDEAAFHDDLQQLIKAALALLIWGGRVWIISTHDGADNPFNELVEDCRAGKRPFKVLRTTFDDALKDGLYRRICLVTGKAWSDAAEKAFRDEIYAFYGEAAEEELGVIPAAGSGVFLDRALIAACSSDAHRVVYWACKPEFVHKSDDVRRAAAQAWFDDEVRPLLARFPADAQSFIGGDIARSGDLTDFAAGYVPRGIFANKLVIPLIVELRNVPFAEQEWILHELIRGLPRFARGKLDARGVGAQIAERTMQAFGATRIEEVKATIEWYRVNMPPVKERFEGGAIEIPRDPDVTNDLRLLRVTRGVPMLPEGVRIRSSRGGMRHGDSAIAVAMVNAAAAQPYAEPAYEPVKRVRPLDEGRPGSSTRMRDTPAGEAEDRSERIRERGAY